MILVNDGSSDKSGEICEKYVSADERFKVINQKIKEYQLRGMQELVLRMENI